MRLFGLAATVFLVFNNMLSLAQHHIIPAPLEVSQTSEKFVLNAATKLSVEPKDAEWRHVGDMLTRYIKPATHFQLKKGASAASNVIILKKVKNETLGKEGYTLKVSNNNITISANTAQGAFYGVQTLRQLLPPRIYANKKIDTASFPINGVTITDYPRFEYRGLHLDVSRHFYSVENVKKFIDLMALHKQNQFHWHLTDDQGWRIESKKYPLLTSVGALRNTSSSENLNENGFYTQKQIKEVIEYASARFINIIPEIDIPGHSSALLTAYPEFGNRPQYEIVTTWGIFHNIIMPKENSFTFLKDIFNEIADLFPGKYIHIGGDECPTNPWSADSLSREFMKQNNMKHVGEIQGYIVNYVEGVLSKKGKTTVGWNEIMDKNINKNAVIMAWQNTGKGITAAGQGYKVIMSPETNLYLNFYQNDDPNEPIAYGKKSDLANVYNYEPLGNGTSSGIDTAILGIQGNLWSEYMPHYHYVEYMAWPRASAVAELGWTAIANRNLDSFVERWNTHKVRLDQLNVNYHGAPINNNFEYKRRNSR